MVQSNARYMGIRCPLSATLIGMGMELSDYPRCGADFARQLV